MKKSIIPMVSSIASKARIVTIVFAISLMSCKKAGDQACDVANGHQLYLGPKGGCYYNNSSGNKEYVDRAMCQNCR